MRAPVERAYRATGCGVKCAPRTPVALPLLHDQHRALRELHNAVGAAADHALVQCRMAFRPDDEQIDLELGREPNDVAHGMARDDVSVKLDRSEEHTSELQSLRHLVCRLLLEKKNK